MNQPSDDAAHAPLSDIEIMNRILEPTAPLPRRNNNTDLTDDELLLFDFLFDVWVPFGALVREAYIIHMNVRFTHSLEAEALQETLKKRRRSLLV